MQDNAILGVKILKVSENTSLCGATYHSPAYGVFREGDAIKKIDGAEVKSIEGLFSGLQKNKGSEKTFVLDRNGTMITAVLKPNEMGQFGFVIEPIRNENLKIPDDFKVIALVSYFALDFVYWLLLLNFLVAVINFLPMNPFDGGRMARIIFLPYFAFLGRPKEETQKKLKEKIVTEIVPAKIFYKAEEYHQQYLEKNGMASCHV